MFIYFTPAFFHVEVLSPYHMYKLFDSRELRSLQNNRVISASAFKSYIYTGIVFLRHVLVFL